MRETSGRLTAYGPGIYVIPPTPWARFWGLLRRTFVATYEDNCFSIAKGAAYSALLAFVPVLSSLTAILVRANAQSVSRILSEFLFKVVPPGSEDLVRFNFTVRGQRPVWPLVVATLISVWAASGAMISLMEGFQAAYRLPSGRPFLNQRAVAALLVFIAAAPAIGASLLILFGNWTEAAFVSWAGHSASSDLKGGVALIGKLVRYLVALGTTVLVTGLLYYFGPNRPIRLRSVWPGASLATALWLLATLGFAWYVRNIANYNVLYGSIGAVIVLLIWMYLLAAIALLGCEFNAERERLLHAK
ncbi:MAG: YihY/virulence factor BrkB family protein [Bryobacteraceae bacterium]